MVVHLIWLIPCICILVARIIGYSFGVIAIVVIVIAAGIAAVLVIIDLAMFKRQHVKWNRNRLIEKFNDYWMQR